MSDSTAFVRKGLAAVLILLSFIVGGSIYFASQQLPEYAEQQSHQRTLRNFLSNAPLITTLDSLYQDADGDLLADPPEQSDLLAKPSTLTISFIASGDQEKQEKIWQPIGDAIGEKLGLPVKYVAFEDQKKQLAALRNGQLHIVGLSSGTVPGAVNTCGFTPICTFGKEDDTFGYQMKFIARKDSKIKDLSGLSGRKVAYSRFRSNSGFKAAFITLMEKHDLLPDRDYAWTITYGHEASIDTVMAKKADAAPIASDILDRIIKEGTVAADEIHEVYVSERFPPAAFGYAYNLAPELKEGIKEAFLSYDWSGTPVEEEFGPSGNVKFVPVSYKDDWANIRRVDRALANAYAAAQSEK